MDGLTGTMTKGRGASKRPGMGNLHVPNDARVELAAGFKRGFASGKLTIKAPRESDSDLFSN
jgi:hypothetical protein